MAVIIQGGTGSGYRAAVTDEGRLKVESITSGTITISGNIIIGSVSASVDSIYVQSGAVYIQSGDNLNLGTAWSDTGSVHQTNNPGSLINYEVPPNDTSKLNAATTLVYSGTAIGSLIKFTSTGSYVQVLTYDGSDNLINVGSWI